MTATTRDFGDLELSILALSCPQGRTAAEISDAEKVCTAIRGDPAQWRLCLQLFLNAADPNCPYSLPCEVQFWLLQTLCSQAPELSVDERSQMRSTMIGNYYLSTLPKLLRKAHADTRSGSSLLGEEDSLLLHRVHLLYVQLIHLDYPSDWSEAFSGILAALSSWNQIRALVADTSHEGSVTEDHAVALGLIYCYLRLLSIFDQEIIADGGTATAERRKIAMRVKDALRLGDVAIVMEMLFQLLMLPSLPPEQSSLAITLARVQAEALYVIGCFADWIDLPEMLSKQRLNILVALFEGQQCMSLDDGSCCWLLARQPSVWLAAGRCLEQLLHKRMSGAQKVLMMQENALLDRLLKAFPSTEDFESDEFRRSFRGSKECLRKMSELVNLVGVQLLRAYEDLERMADPKCPPPGLEVAQYVLHVEPARALELQRSAWLLLEKVLSVALVQFAHRGAPDEVEPFLSDFFKKLKSLKTDAELSDDMTKPLRVPIARMRNCLYTCLEKTLEQIKFPPWFDFSLLDSSDSMDERYEAFMEVREQMLHLFKRILVVDMEQVGLTFLSDIVSALGAALETYGHKVSESDVEAVLSVLKAVLEICRDVSTVIRDRNMEPLRHVLLLIFSNDFLLLHYGGAEILVAVFDLLARFAMHLHQVIPSADLDGRIAVILQMLAGPRGLQSHSSKVTRNAASCFLRLVRANARLVTPPLGELLQSFHASGILQVNFYEGNVFRHCVSQNEALPANPQKPALSFDDQMRILEALGIVLNNCASTEAIPPSLQAAMVSGILDPMLAPLQESGAMLVEYAQKDFIGASFWVCRLLKAIAAVSKGFKPLDGKLSPLWLSTGTAVATALELFGTDAEVRAAALFMCRRLVCLLEKKALPVLRSLVTALYKATLLPPTRSPHLCTTVMEASQLAILVAFAVDQVRSAYVVDNFLLCSVMTDNGHAVQLLPWILHRHICLLNEMPIESEEMLRERQEAESAVYQLVGSVCTNTGEAVLELLSIAELVQLLTEGCSARNIMAFVCVLQCWATIVEASVQSERFDILDLTHLEDLFRSVAVSVALLRGDDCQQLRAVSEMANLFRVCIGARTNSRTYKKTPRQENFYEEARKLMFRTVTATYVQLYGCHEFVVHSMLASLEKAANSREARELLQRFLKTVKEHSRQ